MKKNLLLAGIFASALLMGALDSHAANWVKNDVDIPNQNVETNYYDASSVKTQGKSLYWTEKYDLTDFGAKNYTKHLAQFPECQINIAHKGEVTHHQLDFEIKEGKYRLLAKRNYNKKDELICTDKDMGSELDKSWNDVKFRSPMSERYYIFVTKFKIGNI